MRLNLLVIAFILCSILRGYAQFETNRSIYKKLDTLKFYDVELEVETWHGRTTYWVDRKEVDKKTYETFDHYWTNVDRCKPCFLQTYEKDGRLTKEGVQYGDCQIGAWTEYHKNGKMKLKGRYKENDTNDWEEIWTKGLCSVKHGLWILYDEEGNVLGMEKYVNGVTEEEELGSKF